MSKSNVPDASDTIKISRTKLAEEVGFSKFAARQSELRGIHNIVLDHMCIQHRIGDPDNNDITEICKEVTDLDIGYNLLENAREILDLVGYFPKLRNLTLDGTRLSSDLAIELDDTSMVECFKNVKHLSLSNTLLMPHEVSKLTQCKFPNLETLVVCNNEWTDFSSAEGIILPRTLKMVDLSDNNFESIHSIRGVFGNVSNTRQHLEAIVLKNNRITSVHQPLTKSDHRVLLPQFHEVRELDLRHNAITSWTFFNDLAITFPNLKHLRTAFNPLYLNLQSANGESLGTEYGYMLTVARFSGLETLNFSKITEKDRINAEMYYLKQIASELSQVSDLSKALQIKRNHPRWAELCEEYGEPATAKNRNGDAEDVDPASLAARVAKIDFTYESLTWSEEIPKSFSVYELLGIVGKKLNIMPLRLRLVWETGERDPAGAKESGVGYEGPEWWDSSDEEVDDLKNEGWLIREVVLVPGTRMLGTYLEGPTAVIRVEKHDR